MKPWSHIYKRGSIRRHRQQKSALAEIPCRTTGRQPAENGFTLVEMLITIGILAIVLFPIYEFLRLGALGWQTGESRTEVAQYARYSLDLLCNDIRHAREFYTLAPQQVRFWYQDSNNDEIADADEIITYSWSGISGEDLTRQLDSEPTPTPLANYVDDFTLTYYDRSGAVTAVPTDVHYIHTSIRIKKTVSGQDVIATLVKATNIRNIE